MIFFTADLHLGHENVIAHCNRPFANVEIMDQELISNWNQRVRENDTVYIVGDFCFRNKRPAEEYLGALNGHKHLIIGNHDRGWLSTVDSAFLDSISHMLVIRENGVLITMCHYPLMTWQGASHGSLMVFGHIHNNQNAAYWPLIRASPQMLNAGVDVNDFQPVTLEELKRNNERFKAHQPLQHDSERK